MKYTLYIISSFLPKFSKMFLDLRTVGDEDDIQVYESDEDLNPKTKKQKKIKSGFVFEDEGLEEKRGWTFEVKGLKKGRKSVVDRVKDLGLAQQLEQVVNEAEEAPEESNDSDKESDMEEMEEENEDRIKTKRELSDFFTEAPITSHVAHFTQLKLSRPILKAVTELGYTKPTDIQGRTIPLGLQGISNLVCFEMVLTR